MLLITLGLTVPVLSSAGDDEYSLIPRGSKVGYSAVPSIDDFSSQKQDLNRLRDNVVWGKRIHKDELDNLSKNLDSEVKCNREHQWHFEMKNENVHCLPNIALTVYKHGSTSYSTLPQISHNTLAEELNKGWFRRYVLEGGMPVMTGLAVGACTGAALARLIKSEYYLKYAACGGAILGASLLLKKINIERSKLQNKRDNHEMFMNLNPNIMLGTEDCEKVLAYAKKLIEDQSNVKFSEGIDEIFNPIPVYKANGTQVLEIVENKPSVYGDREKEEEGDSKEKRTPNTIKITYQETYKINTIACPKFKINGKEILVSEDAAGERFVVKQWKKKECSDEEYSGEEYAAQENRVFADNETHRYEIRDFEKDVNVQLNSNEKIVFKGSKENKIIYIIEVNKKEFAQHRSLPNRGNGAAESVIRGDGNGGKYSSYSH